MDSNAGDKAKKNDSDSDQIPDTRPLSLGLNLAVGFVVFTLIGYKIDQNRGGGQGFTLGGIFLGFFMVDMKCGN